MKEATFWRCLCCTLIFPAFRHGPNGERIGTVIGSVLAMLFFWAVIVLARRVEIRWLPKSPPSRSGSQS